MPVPKEQPPRKLSGQKDRAGLRTLERDAVRIRRRDNDLRRKDRGGIQRTSQCGGLENAGVFNTIPAESEAG